jgi:short-subunit dehydrogenase
MDRTASGSVGPGKPGCRLRDEVVLITGATSGIGRSLAGLLHASGAKVIAHGRSDERLQALAAEHEENRFHCVSGDLGTEAGWVQVERAIQGYAPDVLVLNAGYNCGKKLGSAWTDAEISAMLNVNMVAPIRLARTFGGLPKRERARRLVLILSTSCLNQRPMMGLYVAAKMGLMGFGKVLQKEMHELGLRTMLIYPGRMNTGFRPDDRPEYVSPESVAEAIAGLLCLPDDLVPYEFVFRPPGDVEI